MDLSFKVIIAAIVVIVAVLIIVSMLIMFSGKSSDFFSKIPCPWC